MKLDLPQAAASLGAVTYESLYARCNDSAKMILNDLQQYAVDMHPKKMMTAAIGVRHQVKLYDCLVKIITVPTEDFRPALAAAMLIVEEHRQAAFNELAVLRYGEQKTFLTKEKRNLFRCLVHFFITVAPRDTRTLLIRQVDPFKCLRPGIAIRVFNEEHVERLNQFLEPFRR